MTGNDSNGSTVDERDWGLTCAEFLELTTDYLEQALSAPDTGRFEAHLARCEGCTTVLTQLRQQIAATGQLSEDHIDPETLDKLLDAFNDWHADPPSD